MTLEENKNEGRNYLHNEFLEENQRKKMGQNIQFQDAFFIAFSGRR